MPPIKTAVVVGPGNNGQLVATSAAAQAAVITAPPQINMVSRPGNNSQNSSLIGPIEPQQQQQQALVSTVPAATVNANLSLPGMVAESSQMEATQQEEDLVNIEPVGKEYIETKLEGKILSFYCKLCECQFNDPNAKDMHTKGRRHRLAYKKKVDPSLRVDMKGGSSADKKLLRNGREQRTDRFLDNRGQQQRQQQQTMDGSSSGGGGGGGVGGGVGMIKPLMGSSSSSSIENPASGGSGMQQLMATQYNQYQAGGQASGGHHFHGHHRYESFDDKHIIAKHNGIYPTQDEVSLTNRTAIAQMNLRSLRIL